MNVTNVTLLPADHPLRKLVGSGSEFDLKEIRAREQYWVDHLPSIRNPRGAGQVIAHIKKLSAVRKKHFKDVEPIIPSSTKAPKRQLSLYEGIVESHYESQSLSA